jgi:hypothetical protein
MDWFLIDDRRTGKPVVMATVSRDLTPQKRVEAELRMLNERLEQEVTSRTQALSEANWNLHRVATERSRTDARLRELQAEAVSRWRVLAVTSPCRPYLRGLRGGASSKRAAQVMQGLHRTVWPARGLSAICKS